MPKFAQGRNAKAVSDRSGLTFPYREMIVEPGTRLFVHYSESDGRYNIVDHPQNFTKQVFDDGPPVEMPRPSNWYSPQYISQTTTAEDIISFDDIFDSEWDGMWTGAYELNYH